MDTHQIFLCAVKRHELLVVLEFSRRAKVRQLVDRGAVNVDKLHDVARLEVAVHQVVVSEVLHASSCVCASAYMCVLVVTSKTHQEGNG